MPPVAPLFTADEVSRIVHLRGEGNSFRHIARIMKRSKDGVAKAWRRHVNATGQAIPETTDMPGPPSAKEVDVLVDSRELDGTTTIVRKGKNLVKPSDFKKMLGFGDEWIATHHSSNTWQSPMKLKGYDDEGRPIETSCPQDLYQSCTKWRQVLDDANLREAIEEWVSRRCVPREVPEAARRLLQPRDIEPQAVSWGIWDAHIGMYAFAKEVGTDYDVRMALDRCCNSVDDMVQELSGYPICQIYMPIGNDFMHFDNVLQRTSAAQNPLDSDSRFHRAYRGAGLMLEYMVRRATEICNDVRLFYVPGNHDYITSYGLICGLAGVFRDDPKVTVDLNENPQKIIRHGGCAIFYEHGQKIKPNQFPLIFHEHVLKHARDTNNATPITYKEVQIGHMHQKRVREYQAEIPTNGIRIVTNPALCNVDFYHHSLGLIGEPMKSVEAYRYDTLGCRGSHITWARDDKRKI